MLGREIDGHALCAPLAGMAVLWDMCGPNPYVTAGGGGGRNTMPEPPDVVSGGRIGGCNRVGKAGLTVSTPGCRVAGRLPARGGDSRKSVPGATEVGKPIGATTAATCNPAERCAS
jgi:hypothetical protein